MIWQNEYFYLSTDPYALLFLFLAWFLYIIVRFTEDFKDVSGKAFYFGLVTSCVSLFSNGLFGFLVVIVYWYGVFVFEHFERRIGKSE